jgi:hypothetical protein
MAEILKVAMPAGGDKQKRQARRTLMLRANIAFQTKRMHYSFSVFHQDELLKDVEHCNQILGELLDKNDKVSDMSEPGKRQTFARLNSKLADAWRQAECIFRLLKEAWRCPCKVLHCAHVRLQPLTGQKSELLMLLEHHRGYQNITAQPAWVRQAVKVCKAEKLAPLPATLAAPTQGATTTTSTPQRPPLIAVQADRKSALRTGYGGQHLARFKKTC